MKLSPEHTTMQEQERKEEVVSWEKDEGKGSVHARCMMVHISLLKEKDASRSIVVAAGVCLKVKRILCILLRGEFHGNHSCS